MARRKRPPRRVGGILFLWDTAWKLVAIRRALQRREWGWVTGLALSNTVGVLPMVYLWRTRNAGAAQYAEAAEGHSDGLPPGGEDRL